MALLGPKEEKQTAEIPKIPENVFAKIRYAREKLDNEKFLFPTHGCTDLEGFTPESETQWVGERFREMSTGRTREQRENAAHSTGGALREGFVEMVSTRTKRQKMQAAYAIEGAIREMLRRLDYELESIKKITI